MARRASHPDGARTPVRTAHARLVQPAGPARTGRPESPAIVRGWRPPSRSRPRRARPEPSTPPRRIRRTCTLAGSAGSRMARRHDLQKRLVDARAAGTIGDQLLLLEHPAVLTLGRQSDPAHILASDAELAARGIEVLRVERGGEVTYHGPGQLVAYPIVRLHERGLLLRPFVRALEAALVETCACARGRGRPPRRPSGLLVRPGRSGAAQDRRPRPAHRARGQLPRHRPQHHGRPARLRAHRPVRDARRRVDVDRRRARATPDAPPTTASVERAAWIFAAAFAAAIDAPLRARGLRPDGRRAVRTAQGPDHRLVGRDHRRSGVPSRPVRARGRTGRRPRLRLRELQHAGRGRGAHPDAQGLRVPRGRYGPARRASSTATTASPRCRSPRRARPAAGGRSSPRPGSTGRSTPSAPTSSRRSSPAPATRWPRPRRPARPST